MGRYWLDASVLIQAHHRLYPFERDPRFWSWMDSQLDAGSVGMPTVAFVEVTNGNDALVKWCKDRKTRGLNIRPSADVQRHMGAVAAYVQTKHEGRNMQHHIGKFLAGADPWLIAHAMDDGGTVVTQEERAKKHESRIKVPDVCKAMRAAWCDIYEMLDRLKARFS
jgi:hypothetical protein